jgi:hypothetical protein
MGVRGRLSTNVVFWCKVAVPGMSGFVKTGRSCGRAESGADILVIGRPITGAPAAAARVIAEEWG